MYDEYHCEVGDVVEVYSVQGAYPLPPGLGEGMQVRVVRLDQAYRIVERDGREWQVFMANIRAPSATVSAVNSGSTKRQKAF